MFANKGMAANTLTANEIYCSDDTKARDTTVMTDLESYKNVIAQMKGIGWYLKEMSIDTKNNIVKITFTAPPSHTHSSNSKSERDTRKRLFHGKELFRHNKGKQQSAL